MSCDGEARGRLPGSDCRETTGYVCKLMSDRNPKYQLKRGSFRPRQAGAWLLPGCLLLGAVLGTEFLLVTERPLDTGLRPGPDFREGSGVQDQRSVVAASEIPSRRLRAGEDLGDLPGSCVVGAASCPERASSRYLTREDERFSAEDGRSGARRLDGDHPDRRTSGALRTWNILLESHHTPLRLHLGGGSSPCDRTSAPPVHSGAFPCSYHRAWRQPLIL